jgi:biotin carboxyl carrier protein
MADYTPPPPEPPAETAAKPRMSLRARLIFFAVAWLIVLLPFFFWRSTWFGRPLSDPEIAEYLKAEDKPRRIQHALVQLAERMEKQAPSAQPFYPELVRLATHPVEEIRSTDAWVMGHDPSVPDFHHTLLKMLDDPSPAVRNNAALALVSFGDPAGRPHIVRMLLPTSVLASEAGTVRAIAKAGEPIRQGTAVAALEVSGEKRELRSPVTGKVTEVKTQVGAGVQAGSELVIIEPGADQVWESLRALYYIGQPEDLELVRKYARPSDEYPEKLSRQAVLTADAIEKRKK